MHILLSIIISTFFLFSCSSEKPAATGGNSSSGSGDGTSEALQKSVSASGTYELEITTEGTGNRNSTEAKD
jgi:hypothetical protein